MFHMNFELYIVVSIVLLFGCEDLELLSAEELHTPNSLLVIFNGRILGKHRRPQEKIFLNSSFYSLHSILCVIEL